MSLGNLAERLSLADLADLQEFDLNTFIEADDLTEDFADVSLDIFSSMPALATASSEALFDFGVSVVNATDAAFDVFIDDVAAVTVAALEEWAQFLVGADGSQIDVAVTIADIPGSAVATATSGGFFLSGAEIDGITEILTVSQIELAFGVDLNGATPDIIITVDSSFLPGASFDTDPDRVATPGVIDFVSVLAHEIGHGLGFLSLAGNDGSRFELDIDGDGVAELLDTTYGTQVTFEDLGDPFLTPTFTGSTAVGIYGEPIVLENTFESPGSDISHFAALNPDGTLADTILALLNPSVIPGDVVDIGALELAVLADIGYTVEVPADLGLINAFDPLPFTPTVSVAPDLSVLSTGEVVVTVQLDAPSLFLAVPTTVGVTITAEDGTSVTQRVSFGPGETSTDIVLDPTAFLTAADGSITGDLDVEIFFPAQAQLASGGTSETVSLTADFDVDAIFGTDDADVLIFGSGSQTVFGGFGDDFISTGSSADTVFGGEGADTILGGSSSDVLDGGAGDDIIDGGSSSDDISGGEGADVLSGGSGADEIDGGAGNDNIDGGRGDDTIFGDAGDDNISGGSGEDLIDGGGGADTISGGSGADTLLGGTGADTISGGSGGDVIDGGGGSDVLTGGSGADTFIVTASLFGDVDTITDFNDRSDTLILEGFGFTSIDDVIAAATEVGDDLSITLVVDEAAPQTVQTLVLLGTDLEDLAGADIGFSAAAATGGASAGAAGTASVVLPTMDDLFAFGELTAEHMLIA